jgi:hypothetical protein
MGILYSDGKTCASMISEERIMYRRIYCERNEGKECGGLRAYSL